jgi:hypothetical protein
MFALALQLVSVFLVIWWKKELCILHLFFICMTLSFYFWSTYFLQRSTSICTFVYKLSEFLYILLIHAGHEKKSELKKCVLYITIYVINIGNVFVFLQ